jgi:hypothetical protein
MRAWITGSICRDADTCHARVAICSIFPGHARFFSSDVSSVSPAFDRNGHAQAISRIAMQVRQLPYQHRVDARDARALSLAKT